MPVERSERPLAAVRSALQSEQERLQADLRGMREQLEKRLVAAENTFWHGERERLELEGYLSRAAAVLGTDVQDPPDWSRVITALSNLVDRTRELERELLRVRAAAEKADAAAARGSGQAAALARIAARLGLTTASPAEILRALDRREV